MTSRQELRQKRLLSLFVHAQNERQELWRPVLWQLQEQGIDWQSTVSDGRRAIGKAVSTVTPERPHQRDVWHVLHLWKPVQARLDLLVKRLEQQGPVVARQAARLAAGKGLRGRCPKSDVGAHAAELAQVRYVADVWATCRANCTACWRWWC